MAIAKKPVSSASPNSPALPRAGAAAFVASEWDSTRITSLTMGQTNNPEELDKSQARARHWYQNNWLVRSILTLRHGFYDFGFKVSALNKKDDARIEAWAAGHAGTMAAYRR